MREIKFRQAIKATSVVAFRWHYWGYIHDTLSDDFTAPLGKVEWDDRQSYQFTGLLDKNGKEVYEGDVVKWLGWEVKNGKKIRPERVLVVGQKYGWIEDCFRTKTLIDANQTLEVVGNIYEDSNGQT